MGINTGAASTSVQTDNNLLVLIAPASVLAAGKKLTDLKVSDLESDTFVDCTLDFTASSGWADSRTQEDVNDDRLTAPTVFSKPGKVTDGVTTQYVYGSDDSVADPILVENAYVIAAVRRAVPRLQAISATDLWDLWYLQCGAKQYDAPAANSVWTKTQKLFPQRFQVEREVTVAAS